MCVDVPSMGRSETGRADVFVTPKENLRNEEPSNVSGRATRCWARVAQCVFPSFATRPELVSVYSFSLL